MAVSTWAKGWSLSQMLELLQRKCFTGAKLPGRTRASMDFTESHGMEVPHPHTLPFCVLFLPGKPETLSDFKNIPTSPHYLIMPSSLPLYSIIWPHKKKATFILSQATNKSLTQCFEWQPNQTFHKDGLNGEFKVQC